MSDLPAVGSFAEFQKVIKDDEIAKQSDAEDFIGAVTHWPEILQWLFTKEGSEARQTLSQAANTGDLRLVYYYCKKYNKSFPSWSDVSDKTWDVFDKTAKQEGTSFNRWLKGQGLNL